MSAVVVKQIGQEWRLCDHSFHMKGYVIVRSTQGLIILCNLLQHMEGPTAGQIDAVPVKESEMKRLE